MAVVLREEMWSEDRRKIWKERFSEEAWKTPVWGSVGVGGEGGVQVEEFVVGEGDTWRGSGG